MGNQHLKNLLSNYGTRLWGLASLFIFIPIYVHLLGVESYAIIGFYAVVLGVIGFADAGLSSAITREFASNHGVNYKYSLLLILERIYWAICCIVAIIILVFAKDIATIWLKSDTISLNDLVLYVRLIGVGVSLHLLSSLYFGALFALNCQVKANGFNFFWQFSKSAGVLLVMYLLGNNLLTFLSWQVLCNCVYIVVLRSKVIGKLHNDEPFLKKTLNRIPPGIMQYIGGMTLVAIISSINIQADKIIVGSSFTLEVFGYYSIVSTISQIPVILAVPLSTSVFPLFAKFVSQDLPEYIKYTFIKSTFLLHGAVFPAFIVMFFYSPEIIRLWMGDAIDAVWFDDIVQANRWLILGSTFLAMQMLPYYLLLSKGKTRYTIIQGVIQVAVGIPLLIFFVKSMGISGAGITWVLINLFGLIYLYTILFRRYLVVDFYQFLKVNILWPTLVSFVITAMFYFVYKETLLPFYIFLLISAVISISLIFIINNKNNHLPLMDFKSIFKLTHE